MRRHMWLTAALTLCLVAIPAAPAAASHDNFRPGAVVLADTPGASGRVTVVFAVDADEQDAIDDVKAAAADAGVALGDVEAVENNDPDTLRVIGRAPLGTRTGFLARRIPAEAIAPWEPLAEDGELYLRLNRWADVDGLEPVDGAYRVRDVRDVSYRISVWVLLVPLVVLAAAAVVPYVTLRGYAAVVSRRGGAPEDQLHRIRRATAIVQFLAPAVVVAALFATGAAEWVPLALGQIVPGVALPPALLQLFSVLGFLLPLLVAVLATVLAVLPHDRRLRSTQQSTRGGVGQAMRILVLALSPMVLWFVVLGVLPDMRGWLFAPVMVVMLLVLISVQPLIMNKVLATRPLDDDLGERVLAMCRERGLRVSGARLLDTAGGRVANAAISGIIPQVRYVYVTDHLIDILDTDEMDAVLAHEIGHGRGHHLLLKLLTGLAVMGGIGGIGVLLATTGALEWIADSLGLFAFVLAFPTVLFIVLLLAHGVVGVALEKRADDYAAREIGQESLVRALDKLADANKTKRRTGWLWNVLQQHPGMEQRIQRLKTRGASSGRASDVDIRGVSGRTG